MIASKDNKGNGVPFRLLYRLSLANPLEKGLILNYHMPAALHHSRYSATRESAEHRIRIMMFSFNLYQLFRIRVSCPELSLRGAIGDAAISRVYLLRLFFKTNLIQLLKIGDDLLRRMPSGLLTRCQEPILPVDLYSVCPPCLFSVSLLIFYKILPC
jgi:hypothetical protein